MGSIRKHYEARFKAKLALDAVRQEKTVAQLSAEYGVHSSQIAKWKKQLMEELPGIFSGTRKKRDREDEEYTRHPFYGSRRMAAWIPNTPTC